jgi:uncharacterized membrane protein
LDILTTAFWISVIVAAILAAEYYVQLRRARREYEKARGVVEDVVFSFNRQLKLEARKVEAGAYKVEAISSRVDDIVRGVNELRNGAGNMKETLHAESQERESVLARLAGLEKSAGEAAALHQSLLSKVVVLEEARVPGSVLDTGFEAVIPIKREKALAQLTDTEVSVLELLISGGSKTAPEIKESVKLSREHTARLMKKLYEEGYLERETGKIPFRYTVKKEMERFLKKAESQPA